MSKIIKNCLSCTYFGSDDSGDDWGSNPFPVCEKDIGKDNLKSFPFKTEQSCFVWDFWAVCEQDEEIGELFYKDNKDLKMDNWESWKRFREKYKDV